MLQWVLADGTAPYLDSWDTRSLSRCCRYTWDVEECRRVGDLGVREGWVVAIPILREIDIFCVDNDFDTALERKLRRDVFLVLSCRPQICAELRRTVLRQ